MAAGSPFPSHTRRALASQIPPPLTTGRPAPTSGTQAATHQCCAQGISWKLYQAGGQAAPPVRGRHGPALCDFLPSLLSFPCYSYLGGYQHGSWHIAVLTQQRGWEHRLKGPQSGPTATPRSLLGHFVAWLQGDHVTMFQWNGGRGQERKQ